MGSNSDNYLENIVSLTPVQSGHKDFLLKLFKECRPDLSLIDNLNEKQKNDFMIKQFTIEQDQLSKMYPNAEFNIVMFNEEPIGRFYIYYDKEIDRIIEIGLLGGYRSKGIGGNIVRRVIEKAIEKKKTVSLQVAWFNQEAYRFYEKLGFKMVENNGIAYEMKYISK